MANLNMFLSALDMIASVDVNKTECEFQIKRSALHWTEGAEKHASGSVGLAISASDIAFNFGDVAIANVVVVSTATEVTVKINGTGNPALVVKSKTASDGLTVPGLLILVGNSVTSLHLGNPSGLATADARVFVAGTE